MSSPTVDGADPEGEGPRCSPVQKRRKSSMEEENEEVAPVPRPAASAPSATCKTALRLHPAEAVDQFGSSTLPAARAFELQLRRWVEELRVETLRSWNSIKAANAEAKWDWNLDIMLVMLQVSNSRGEVCDLLTWPEGENPMPGDPPAEPKKVPLLDVKKIQDLASDYRFHPENPDCPRLERLQNNPDLVKDAAPEEMIKQKLTYYLERAGKNFLRLAGQTTVIAVLRHRHGSVKHVAKLLVPESEAATFTFVHSGASSPALSETYPLSSSVPEITFFASTMAQLYNIIAEPDHEAAADLVQQVAQLTTRNEQQEAGMAMRISPPHTQNEGQKLWC
ncbi:unnamed protein product [Amoebophrya sp. A120]|nr:unnamed protein product [Amoebophrya sp. A120]|eukprot:GSA120T00025626001.1